MKRFGNTNFDVEYCRAFSPEHLRRIYGGSMAEDVELLIAELYPDEDNKPANKPANKKNAKTDSPA